MRSRTANFLAVVVFAAIPGVLAAQSSGQPSTVDQVIDRIVAQEKAEMQLLHQYSPLVETYIQLLRPDPTLGTVPAGDKYYLGKANLAKGLDLQPLTSDKGAPNLKYTAGGLGTFISMSMQFLPRGFLQMIYLDTNFDKQHYKFDYVRREFLGEVRCLVFDVTPAKENDHGRFEGRIWVEDQGFHIVRFNGAYQKPSKATYFFHFDSWRVYAGDNQWLPTYIYSEESDLRYGVARKLMFKAQVRLWGYDLNAVKVRREQELNKVLVEAKTPVKDQANAGTDYSPIE